MKVQFFCATFLLAISPLCESKDHIHLQWSICDRSPSTVRNKLGIHDDEPHKNTPISYYDTKPPTHIQNGLMFRTKTRKGQEISSIKVRFPEETRDAPVTVKCVWDRYDHGTYFTCEKQSPLNGSDLWSEEQVQFAERYGAVIWNRLVAFGPYPNPKWKLRLRGYNATFDDVAADSFHLMEIEVKVPRFRSARVYRRVTEYLNSCGITLCSRQEARTMRLFRAKGCLEESPVLVQERNQ